MRFLNLRFVAKLAISFGAIFIGVIASTLLLFFALRDADEAAARNRAAHRTLDALGQAATAHLDQAHTARGFLIILKDRHAMLYGQAVTLFQQKIAEAKQAAADMPDILPLLAAVESASNDWRIKTGDPMLKFAKDPKTYDKAVEVAKDASASEQQQAFRAAFEAVNARLEKLVDETDAIAMASIAQSKMAHVAGTLLALLAAIGACVVLLRSTAHPILRLTETMRRLAAGDSGVQVRDAERADEIGSMAKAVLTFRDAALARQHAEADAATARRAAETLRTSTEADRQRDMRQAQEVCEVLDRALGQLAQGEFTQAIDRPFAGDLDRLRVSFNASVTKLRDTMRALLETSHVITTGVDEIATASDDLSRRTERQAASLEEAAASIEQTATMVRKTAEGAAHAHEIVTRTRDDVRRSGEVVERSVAAMGDIEKASKQIHDFIGIIDEIAFQTNLLALNAGVEAARAGEAGRGFAVVASEVRALAQRSATAAQQVKDLVGFSARSITDGVTLVGEAGAALTRITAQITGIDQVVSEIAAGTREQASGLDQLNVAVRQIDESTQQNAAMAEETTAAVGQVAGEAQRLRHLMQDFRIDARNGAAARAA